MDAQKNLLQSGAMEYRIAAVLEVRCLRQPLRRLRTKGVIRLRSTRKSYKNKIGANPPTTTNTNTTKTVCYK